MGGDDYVIDDNGFWNDMYSALAWYRDELKKSRIALIEQIAAAGLIEAAARERGMLEAAVIAEAYSRSDIAARIRGAVHWVFNSANVPRIRITNHIKTKGKS